jgi:hypothetical protein
LVFITREKDFKNYLKITLEYYKRKKEIEIFFSSHLWLLARSAEAIGPALPWPKQADATGPFSIHLRRATGRPS